MTYSLIALDLESRTLGVACATGGPALGGFVPHLLPGVGAAITQGYSTHVLAAERGLAQLGEGCDVVSIIERLRADDRGAAWRQLALLDMAGRGAGWTGEANLPECDMHIEPGLVLAGNMLASRAVVPAMRDAYLGAQSAGKPLSLRLLGALEAGQQVGGDYRGSLSAALKVRAPGGLPLDLRIDDASDAVAALAALYRRLQLDDDFQQFLGRLPTADNPHRH
ncbi:DUF1028 domain-containing protein [Billgrantia montanilacus]|uniref:DUF1028 domain-containing protein n=1 Tax=Billgrantia montanilacus TaxID=2282305 RepID=A0A368TQ69_9GAMM|nr:DUF1028 domain-containing protein [Halomonas montanilacus]RCV86730.1 DUF1028 domain-containing protein [Halomonas montanilacus]